MGERKQVAQERRRKSGFKLKLRPNGRRLLSGAIAGAFSRIVVAPLETIRTHLMVGSHGHSLPEIFHWIITNEGWPGLFRGNAINVIRVAPSKAIEVSVIVTFSLSHYFYSLVKSFKQVFTHEQSKQASLRLQTAFLHVFHNFFSLVSFRSGRVFLPL
jgi:hypothetical protein